MHHHTSGMDLKTALIGIAVALIGTTWIWTRIRSLGLSFRRRSGGERK